MAIFMEIHASIAAETLGHWMGIPITNTLLMSWVVVFVLATFAFLFSRRMTLAPGKIQLAFEMVTSGVFDFVENTLESKEAARKYFPLIASIFFFIFTANMLEFIPGVGSVGIIANEAHEIVLAEDAHAGESGAGHGAFTPLLRSMNTDLNMTLALTIIVFLVIEVSGILAIGFFKYMSKFFPFQEFHKGISSGLIALFVGLIEFISEWIRLISFSFRLFGNIFAGEVLISVAAFFLPFFLPVPFILFELFVGFIQAAIFSMLTLFFLKLALMEPTH
jgi:F-type H+-transporting ATPase subunit a